MPWTPRIAGETAPLYIAIADAIANDAESGHLAPGTRLPTHRALAATLGIDVTTVSRAYAEAHRRGLIVGHVGRGTYVRGARPPALAAAPPPLLDLTVNVPPEPSDVCDDAMRQSLGDLAKAPATAALLAYAPAGGSRAHRESGRLWCAERGVAAAIDRVLVCGGAQQALTAILSAHCEPGDTILTEELTYPGFLAAARMLRLRVVGVPIDGDGIVPDGLLHACKVHRPRLLLVTPTLQNPTAVVMSVGRRRRVASVVRDRELLVVEDDTYGPLAPNAPRPVSALVPELSYYVSSFSKAVTPALRTAFIVTPTTAHATRVSRQVQATGLLVPPIMAEVAARWISSGTTTRIVHDRRREAEARQALLRGALGLSRNAGSPHALHHWLELPRQWDRASDFVDTLRRRGVLVTAGDAFAVDTTNPVRAVRVSLGAAPSHSALASALETIGLVMHEDPEPTRPPR